MTDPARKPFEDAAQRTLIALGEPPLFDIEEGTGPIVILGPHNGFLVPKSLYDGDKPLGLDPAFFDPANPLKRHETCDWGAQALFDQVRADLAGLGCHFMSARYSRLVCDHNRASGHWLTTEMGELGGPVPRNAAISEAELRARRDEFYNPWFEAARELVAIAQENNGGHVLVLDLHSFTPTWHGAPRAFDVGTMLLGRTPVSDAIDAFYEAACSRQGLRYRPDEPYSLQRHEIRHTFAAKTTFADMGAVYHGIEHRNDRLQTPKTLDIMTAMVVDAVDHLLPRIDWLVEQTMRQEPPSGSAAPTPSA